jgi:hypothetical protein
MRLLFIHVIIANLIPRSFDHTQHDNNHTLGRNASGYYLSFILALDSVDKEKPHL